MNKKKKCSKFAMDAYQEDLQNKLCEIFKITDKIAQLSKLVEEKCSEYIKYNNNLNRYEIIKEGRNE
tara:strand:+ start:551 stop:751 length:201 start_codon:yes stop_codon:yes gene_type:complete